MAPLQMLLPSGSSRRRPILLCRVPSFFSKKEKKNCAVSARGVNNAMLAATLLLLQCCLDRLAGAVPGARAGMRRVYTNAPA